LRVANSFVLCVKMIERPLC